MGYEHQIRLPTSSPSDIDAILRGIDGFEGYNPLFKQYSFRRAATGAMPDAHASIEPDGVYFCDNGCGSALLLDIVRALEEQLGQVLIVEL